jgi:hypothetical protein
MGKNYIHDGFSIAMNFSWTMIKTIAMMDFPARDV